mgnify:CR=1 FL=1
MRFLKRGEQFFFVKLDGVEVEVTSRRQANALVTEHEGILNEALEIELRVAIGNAKLPDSPPIERPTRRSTKYHKR